MSNFRFKQFSVQNDKSALKVGTDAVILGAAMTINGSDTRMLDIGTGTGVIALMAAQRSCPGCRITAIDIDSPSSAEAAGNFAASPWADGLESINVPLQDYVPETQFDLIFSNPPFYDSSLLNPDPRSAAARHSASLSFADIFSFAASYLAADGRLSLIVPAESETVLLRTAASFGLHPFRILRIRTVAAKPPRRIVAEFTTVPRPSLSEEELILQAGESRTPEYTRLTENFYL